MCRLELARLDALSPRYSTRCFDVVQDGRETEKIRTDVRGKGDGKKIKIKIKQN